MQLAGKHVFDASLSKVWDMLMDTDVLSKVIPGISRLEKTGENTFKSILDIKLGPVNGSFTGNLQLEEIEEQKGFTLKAQQNSKIGNANAAVNISLVPVTEDQTEISFQGDVRLSGMLSGLGQRLIGGVSNTLTKQFFSNLETELAKSASINP